MATCKECRHCETLLDKVCEQQEYDIINVIRNENIILLIRATKEYFDKQSTNHLTRCYTFHVNGQHINLITGLEQIWKCLTYQN